LLGKPSSKRILADLDFAMYCTYVYKMYIVNTTSLSRPVGYFLFFYLNIFLPTFPCLANVSSASPRKEQLCLEYHEQVKSAIKICISYSAPKRYCLQSPRSPYQFRVALSKGSLQLYDYPSSILRSTPISYILGANDE